MFDAPLRKMIDPPLDWAGLHLARAGISANGLTIFGLIAGLSSVPLLAVEQYILALYAIIVNRLVDGLDGAVARQVGKTEFGGYLDIVCDFVFYSAVVFGFALANPEQNAVIAAFVMLSLVGTGSSFLAYAILAAKHGVTTVLRGKKTFYYLGGLTEGGETIVFLVAICTLPQLFPILAVIFAMLCWVTTFIRIIAARRAFLN